MSVRLHNLLHSYRAPNRDSRRVLDIPAWEFPDGAQVLLRGVSGSGKTTLFNIIAGLLRPTSGTVYIDGEDIYALSEATRDRFRARSIGYVFQNHLLIDSLTALENVVMPMAFARLDRPACWANNAVDLLALVGLAGFESYKPRQLSTGQRLRVAVARALANRPKLILADEPTAALDVQAGVGVIDLLKQACVEQNAVLILASHDPQWGAYFTQHLDLHGGLLSAAEVRDELVV